MKKTFSPLHRAFIALLIGSLLFAGNSFAADYGKLREENQRKIKEITNYILSLAKKQRVEWQRKYAAQETKKAKRRKENSPNMANHNNDDQENNPNDEPLPVVDETELVPDVFVVDIEEIKEKVKAKYKANEDDAKGYFPKINISSKIELEELASKKPEVKEKYPFPIPMPPALLNTLPQEEQDEYHALKKRLDDEEAAQVARELPLYRENQNVEISVPVRKGKTKRVLSGAFQRIGQHKIKIGKEIIDLSDLPENIRACFDPDLNRIARAKRIAQHPVIGQYNLRREEIINKIVKEWLLEQLEQNLSAGWIYVNGCWVMPSDIVLQVLSSNGY